MIYKNIFPLSLCRVVFMIYKNINDIFPFSLRHAIFMICIYIYDIFP